LVGPIGLVTVGAVNFEDVFLLRTPSSPLPPAASGRLTGKRSRHWADASSLCQVMTAEDVLFVLALLRQANADVWIGGGWGIDALVGEQTRNHRDLDLMHRQDQEDVVVAALHEVGFVETLNWRPIRFVERLTFTRWSSPTTDQQCRRHPNPSVHSPTRPRAS
jgi:hypothetical protein